MTPHWHNRYIKIDSMVLVESENRKHMRKEAFTVKAEEYNQILCKENSAVY